jgi:hypothetical protein
MKSTIVGAKYRGPAALAALARLRPGDRLRLVREPDNPHDPNAVAVYSELLHLGYLPRGVNRPVSDLIMSADTVHAIVTHEAIVEEGQVRFGPRIEVNNHFGDLLSQNPDG